MPSAKAPVRLSAVFLIRKTTAKKSLVFLKQEMPLLSFMQSCAIDKITIKNTDKHQRLGDIWAKTIVIEINEL